mgnify:FL=1
MAVASLYLGVSPLAAQQTKGNIVEYFGKERVERVDEGMILHTFRQGYFLPVTAPSGYLFTTSDGLGWEIATGKFKAPSGNDLTATNYGRTREAVQWTPIEADSTGKFANRALRRAYVFTEYKADKPQIALLESSGNTRTFINGMPHEGDHYDFAYTLIPFRMQKGMNEFIFTPGRFGRVEAKLIIPSKPVMLTKRDMTLPDIINGEGEKWAAIRIVNAQEKALTGLKIQCTLENGESATLTTDDVMPMMVRKVKFRIPGATSSKKGETKATVILQDKSGKEIDRTEISLQQKDASSIHERSFISDVDGSVQYYSVNPSTTQGDNQALFLSVHGASVEARNQARAYVPKDWGHIIAPTNRRPFGFNWEEWGRIDAMEVLAEAEKVFKTDPAHTYLTGHSMGGHGTWFLGVTYPDRFAAIAPCASYPDIAKYSRPNADAANVGEKHFPMICQAANAGRVLDLRKNFLQSGIYILHGDSDNVVPIEQVRRMREILGTFHPDFCYYEYPGGSHWYSNESVDWKPIFDYFRWHSVPSADKVKQLEFHTASPAISAKDYWVTINQQDTAYDFSSVSFKQTDNGISGTTSNVASLTFDFPALKLLAEASITIDNETIPVDGTRPAVLKKVSGKWSLVEEIPVTEKYPSRYGGFKQAFDNRVVFVYATGGNKEENTWYQNKARFDAETFLYRGNGSIDVIADKDFIPSAYADRNVVLYGNASNNKAWNKLLKNAPIQVLKGEIRMGDKVLKGNDLGTYFVYPRPDSPTASVGVVAGTGIEGMKATYPNDYISGITGFPDLLIFNVDMLKEGIHGIQVSGFFGNDWSVEDGCFITE